MGTKTRLLSLMMLLTSVAEKVSEEDMSQLLTSRGRCETGDNAKREPALSELRFLRDQLDKVIEGMVSGQKSATECEDQPLPLTGNQTSFQRPDRVTCAHSCLQLRDQGGSPQDGVYWFTGMPVPVFCDFSHDGGGWTLLLTAVSRQGWDLLSVLSRNELSPSLDDNFSILRHADAIRDLSSGGRFAYRIETQAEKGRQRWGGIWFAPRHYSFVDETGSQTEVRLVRRFDQWSYKDLGIERRMPWLRVHGGDTTVLTTNGAHSAHWWGTLVTHPHATANPCQHSPWMEPEAVHSGSVLYWMREQEL